MNVGQIRKYDEDTVFFRERNLFIFLKLFFTKMRRHKKCRRKPTMLNVLFAYGRKDFGSENSYNLKTDETDFYVSREKTYLGKSVFKRLNISYSFSDSAKNFQLVLSKLVFTRPKERFVKSIPKKVSKSFFSFLSKNFSVSVLKTVMISVRRNFLRAVFQNLVLHFFRSFWKFMAVLLKTSFCVSGRNF